MHGLIFLQIASLLAQPHPLQLWDYCESPTPAVLKHSVWADSPAESPTFRREKVSTSSGKWDHPPLQALPHAFAMPSLPCTWPEAESRLSADRRAEQLKTPGFINSNLLTNQHHEIKKQKDFKLYSRPTWHVKSPEAQMLVKMSISWLPLVER